MPIATHRHKKKPGTTVRLIVWSHKEGIPGSDLNLSIYYGDVYYQTVEGEPTNQEKMYDFQMIGHIKASSVNELFEPVEGMEDYHAKIIETVTTANGT